MSERALGGIAVIDTEHGLPVAGVAVIEQVAPVGGAVQVTRVPLAGVTEPALAVHVAETDEVISTCSLTPTVLRVSGLPPGADTKVLVAMVQRGGGEDGGLTGGAGAGVGAPPDSGMPASFCMAASSDRDTGPGPFSASPSSVVRPDKS